MTAEPVSRQDTLVDRAAKYFGWYDQPRTSIRINNETCLIVAEGFQGRTLLMSYNESSGRPYGEFVTLTERAQAELIRALEGDRAAF